ncbi:MAG: cyclic pyranopterin monophosphate synthase MoaC [Rhodothermales bacterium]|nr:cyclic pyranopterin monophosphate synthase MoaC [Rhodothermales bacterium]
MSEGAVLTHVDPQGGVHMVDVSDKPSSVRTAVATGKVVVGETAFGLIHDGEVPKGDVMSLSQVAGIMGAKQTSKLIPLCHDVALKGIDVDLSLNEEDYSVEIRAFAKSIGPTGVEMEALTAVTIAALTVYDMCKSVSKDIAITGIHLLAKTGGQSGDYLRS